jgi:hypothetical protein
MRALVVLALLLGASPQVQAGTCADGGRRQQAYEAGVEQGKKLVESAWSSLGGDCDQRDRLEKTVLEALERLTPPSGSSESVACRYDGVEDGAKQALAAIAATCQGS